jgi:hypothetical protein
MICALQNAATQVNEIKSVRKGGIPLSYEQAIDVRIVHVDHLCADATR